ncbi:MAG: hypothetical protein ACRCU1_08470 [Alsobacter sp.]
MAAIVWLDVTTVDASLAATAAPLQLVILDLIHELVNVRVCGGEDAKRTKMVRVRLAAHLAKVFGQVAEDQVAGPVTSRSMGGISKSMAAAAMTDDGLTRTGHGQLYQMLVKLAARGQGFRS